MATREAQTSGVVAAAGPMIDLNVSDFVAPNVMDTLEVRSMSPLLRFLQLLCENHNRDLQVRALAVVCMRGRTLNEVIIAGFTVRHSYHFLLSFRHTQMSPHSRPPFLPVFSPRTFPLPCVSSPHTLPSSLCVLHLIPSCPPPLAQNLLRHQDGKREYDLVLQTLQFLDSIFGGTNGGLGLVKFYINDRNTPLIMQCLETLTEYCQGPCADNQVCACVRVCGVCAGEHLCACMRVYVHVCVHVCIVTCVLQNSS